MCRSLTLTLLQLLGAACVFAKPSALQSAFVDSITSMECQNLREDCDSRAREGHCKLNPRFMHPHCPVACNFCQNLTSVGSSKGAIGKHFRRHQLTKTNRVDVLGASVGVPQRFPANVTRETKQAIIDRLDDAHFYIHDDILKDEFYRAVWDLCRNRNPKCAGWAVAGKCKGEKEDFMSEECAPVCKTCEYLHVETWCPIDPNMKNAWYPGDLNRMFERIVDSPEYAHYNTTVLSRPSYADGNSSQNNASHMLGPWVITIDDFISAEDSSTLIQLGANEGYEISVDSGPVQEDGTYGDTVSRDRTSTNAWCEGDCLKHNVTRAVVARIVDLIQIPEDNSESLQMLRYIPGQFYGRHHDYIIGQEKRAEGARILTVFLYLNDVEEGGATNFSELDLAVFPKRGRALIWPSVLNESPHEKDPRTDHEAQKVIKGIKYGANAWYHMRNHVIPSDRGC